MILLKKIRNNKELANVINALLDRLKSDFNNKDIFIKPNLGGRYPVLRSENNNFEFLQLLCKGLQDRRCGNIEIGHSSLHGYEYDKKYSFDELIKLSRYTKLLSLKNVKLVNLDNVGRYKEKIEAITFEIPNLLKNKYYINLCKLKTHMETGVSLSLKNQMGLVNMENKKQMHKYGIHKYIAYLAKFLTPNLNIIDGIIAMEGDGPHHGKNIRAGLLICGDNMVEVDSLACKMAVIDSNKIEHLKIAANIGIGNLINDALVDKKIIKRLLPARKYIKKGSSLYIWPTTSCSGCIFSLNKAVNDIAISKSVLRLIKMLFFGKTTIIMGNCENTLDDNKVVLSNIIAIGDCTKNVVNKYGIRKCAFGCPPNIDDIKKMLCSQDRS
jgi:uncharacterized protein (DUF362 family)